MTKMLVTKRKQAGSPFLSPCMKIKISPACFFGFSTLFGCQPIYVLAQMINFVNIFKLPIRNREGLGEKGFEPSLIQLATECLCLVGLLPQPHYITK